ncbi:sensor domain-containing protein [Streptomyces sp. DSM 44915]|uniref:histidine kinase n=1 Tax=Streptomyces chisholmiae TaxID=3075540 RepID=A0ABU2JRM5_9ACTN|nr:sensor domain-containing protein [Streptomyces sp. DSM 44915]MDT0267620.1 sensor domain-containing protein [Streptomyces sp. DSM 44915]
MTVLRLTFGARTWREGLYALLNLPLALAGFVSAFAGLAVSGALLITFVGLPLMALVLLFLRGFGSLERGRARLLLGQRVPPPDPLRTRDGKAGLLAWIGAVLRNNASWRATAYALVHLPWAIVTFTVMAVVWAGGFGALSYPLWFWALDEKPGINVGDEGGGWVWDNPLEVAMVAAVGLLLLVAGGALIRGMAAVDRALVAALLGPSSAAARVWQLEEDRSVVVDTSAADLRRIERDLHDGAQARLVALAMDLGLAKEKLTQDPEAAARMVDEAHGEIKLALQELRDLARGIHPAVLTDRGLGPALSAVATRCTVPVTIDIDLDQRPAPAIEGIAYFTTSELLQNISKHSNAHHAHLEIWRTHHRLMLQITDDGQGGATPTPNSGLAGLAERLTAVDGLLAIDSPHGGPTTITAELPWRDRDGSAGGRPPGGGLGPR